MRKTVSLTDKNKKWETQRKKVILENLFYYG